MTREKHLGVVNEHAVLKVLAAVHEVDTEHVELGAGATEVGVGAHAHKVAAEANNDVRELGVTAERQTLVRGVQNGIVPFLQRHDGQVRAVASLNLNSLVEGSLRGSGVRQDDGSLREVLGANHDVLRAGALDIRHVDANRSVELSLCRDLDDGCLLKAVPRDDGSAIAGSKNGSEALVVAGHGFDDDGSGSVNRHGRIARVVVGGFEEALDATHRGESPVLLASVRNDNVVQVERGRTVRARRVSLLGVSPVRVGLVHGVNNSVGGRHQPTDPSICSSMRRLSSRAYSIGSSLAIGSTKPRTIIAMASFSSRPRLIR